MIKHQILSGRKKLKHSDNGLKLYRYYKNNDLTDMTIYWHLVDVTMGYLQSVLDLVVYCKVFLW